MLLTPAQIKPKSFESRRNSFFHPGRYASHVYVRALALGCFYSHVSTRTFRRALTASVDSCAEIDCPFSGVIKSGRVWRKVPESDARSVQQLFTHSFSGWSLATALTLAMGQQRYCPCGVSQHVFPSSHPDWPSAQRTSRASLERAC